MIDHRVEISDHLRQFSFPHHENAIKLLETPTEFYNTLRERIKTAQNTIILSALYLGNGKLEKQLIQDLEDAIKDIENRPNLSISLIFDHSRAQRGPNSSLDLLSPLLSLASSSPSRFSVYLYEVPLLRHFPYSYLPAEMKEIAAVYHVKFFLFDETVILSGANLAHDYFTTRQDRYWLLGEAEKREKKEDSGIVQFLNSFFRIIREDCHILSKNGKIEKVNSLKKIEDVANELKELVSCPSPPPLPHADVDSVSMIPLLQHHSLNIKYEEYVLFSLFNSFCAHSSSSPTSSSDSSVSVRLSTPYTNFCSALSEKLLEICYKGGKIEMLGPDEASHGFAGGRGIKAFIPQMHLASLLSSLKSSYLKIRKDTASKGSSSVSSSHFYENFEHKTFQRIGWTYHAKGLWFKNKNQGIVGSYIGSSNFGERSWKRDFELGFLFYQRKQDNNVQHTKTPSTSTSFNFKDFLKHDYSLLQQYCVKNDLLRNKIASFVVKNPSSSLSVSSKHIGFGGYFQSKMVSGFAKIIKTYL
jgi:CDP-diacylglycerol--glycerol-3-phosphate 3-phosphatidyltransferase